MDGPIVSPMPVNVNKRPRSSRYESDSSISSATSCDSDSDSDSPSSRDSGIFDCESRPKKRQKRKPNPETMAYYHRCLGHSGDVRQLQYYGIDLSQEIDDKAPCVSCTIKKMQQIKHTSHIRPGRRPFDLIYSDIA